MDKIDIAATIAPAVRRRGGAVFRFGTTGITAILRCWIASGFIRPIAP